MTEGTGTGRAVEPRLAASVILLREGSAGLETFVQHRVSTMDFAPGMVVFPGGRVDAVDRQGWDYAEDQLGRHAIAWRRSSLAAEAGVSLQDAGTLLAAALREVFEEAGIQLDSGSLLPWANWITPADQPKRFDTFFFLAVPGSGVEPRHLTTEASNSLWMPISDILAQETTGSLKLMPPTFVLLGELAALGSIDAVLSAERDIIPVSPPAGALEEFLKRRR